MDQDARKDVSGWETRGQKRNLPFNICFGGCSYIYVSISFWGYREETRGKKKKPRRNCKRF
jgi:hypothetical protein